MRHRRLVHKNPHLNEKHIWYRLVADFPQLLHYLVVIHGVEGVVNSTVHAVPKDEYTIESEPTAKIKKAVEDDGSDLL